jgi:hypothetical protein
MNDRRNRVEPWWDPNDPLEEGFRILARIILRKIRAQREAERALHQSEVMAVNNG